MARSAGGLLWKLAESDEIEIETRRDARSPVRRTTIWIVPTSDGVYVRSVRGKTGRWWQEAVASTRVTIRVGPEKVDVRPELEKNPSVVKEVSNAYREKYGERWPNATDPLLRRPTLDTTLRLTELE